MMSQLLNKIDCIQVVWNAEKNLRGAIAAIGDLVRGIHSCSLCGITYNTFTPKSEWTAYKASLGIPVIELYKNQLNPAQQRCINGNYPAVLAQIDGQYIKLLSPAEIEACEGALETLLKKLNTQIQPYQSA